MLHCRNTIYILRLKLLCGRTLYTYKRGLAAAATNGQLTLGNTVVKLRLWNVRKNVPPPGRRRQQLERTRPSVRPSSGCRVWEIFFYETSIVRASHGCFSV